MKNLISGMVLAVILCGLYATAQQPHVTQTLPSATVKLNGSSGGGSGTGFECDLDDAECVFAPTSEEFSVMVHADDFSILSFDGLTDIFGCRATAGCAPRIAWRMPTGVPLRGDINQITSSATATGTYNECISGSGNVTVTLPVDGLSNSREIWIYDRAGESNACTIAAPSGQKLDGVTNGTVVMADGEVRRLLQVNAPGEWRTMAVYPVTGTLSGLTAPKIPVAASASTVADSDLSYFVGKLDSSEPVNGRKLCFTDSQAPPNVYCLVTSDGSRYGGLVATSGSAEGSARVPFSAAGFRSSHWVEAPDYVNVGGTALYSPAFLGRATLLLGGTNGEVIWNDRDAPDTQLVRDAAGQLGVYGSGSTYGQLNVGTIQQSYSKALVDATATDVVQVPVASNSYEGFTMDYTVFATDATDYQVRQGSVPVAVLNVGGTETCVFGTATEAVNASAGTLTVAFDCTAGTNTVMVRANANTSLASTTVFTIQQRINLTSGTAVLVPQ